MAYTPFILIIVALSLAATVTVLPAYGHAIPVDYLPAANTIIHSKENVPPQVTISFSERPDPKVSYIRVTDSQNVRVDNNDFTVSEGNGRQAYVTLDMEKMEDGIYSVSWFTMSLDDGHITAGAYVFGVGDVTIIGEPGQETTYVTSMADALAKWPLIVALAGAAGMSASSLFLGRRFLPSGSSRLGKLLLMCAVTIAASSTGLLLLQAQNLAEATGSHTAAIESLLSSSLAGTVWVLRIATAAAIAGFSMAYVANARKGLLVGILTAAAVGIFSNSMLGHNSAATFIPQLAVTADWIHFMAVSTWVGGVFYLAAVFVPAARKLPDAARVLALSLPRFSLLATISLGIIGVTGIYMAWVHLHSLDSLVSTDYGGILAVKLAAALPMVLFGAYHQLRLHKSLVVLAAASSSGQEIALKFCRTVKAEAVIGIAVLLAASILTVTSPPAEGMAHEMYTHNARVDDTNITLEIMPFKPGFNTFTARFDQAGSPATNIHHVTMRFSNEDAGVGPIVITLDNSGNGQYSATGGYLSQGGEWKIDLIAQRMGAYDLNDSFRVMLTADGPQVQAAPEFDAFAVLAIALAAAVAGGSIAYAVRSQKLYNKTISSLESS